MTEAGLQAKTGKGLSKQAHNMIILVVTLVAVLVLVVTYIITMRAWTKQRRERP